MSRKLGVIIGRFQCIDLHEGYKHLFKEVAERCDKIMVLIGCSEEINMRNPFSFEDRIETIMLADFDKLYYINMLRDNSSDEIWSENLDSLLDTFSSNSEITLYGSRDNFFSHYSGKYPTVEIPELPGFSSTISRDQILSTYKVNNHKDYLYGKLKVVTEIYAAR